MPTVAAACWAPMAGSARLRGKLKTFAIVQVGARPRFIVLGRKDTHLSVSYGRYKKQEDPKNSAHLAHRIPKH